MADKTDTAQLRPYLEAGMQLVPLHNHDHFDVHKGKRRERGKSPVHANWTKRAYRNADQVEHMRGGDNVGVRLRACELVVDVDPRHFPTDPATGRKLTLDDALNPLARLCEDTGLDPSAFPTVVTGSGGLHVYMTKPDAVSTRDSLPAYEGVEFKTLKRQVVAAGSVHPATKGVYLWDATKPGLDLFGPEPAPAALLDLIARPPGAPATGGGEHDQEELASMLDHLDPEDFRDQTRWFTLMQACHHATAGDGRAEFVEWSTRDPLYADDGGLIGRRWDSLHAGGDGAMVTYRTLHKFLRDAGKGDAVPRPSAADDFDAVSPDEVPLDATESPSPGGSGSTHADPVRQMVAEFNERYCGVLHGGTFKIYAEELDEVYGNRRVFQSMSREAFCQYYEDEQVAQVGMKRKLSRAELWLQSPYRRKYHGLVMDPQGLPQNAGKLNLWQGWSVEPKPGDWSLLRELIAEGLCDGDLDMERYVHMWIAHLFQRPWESPEVALVFRGGQGTGKGTLFRCLMYIVGAHGMAVSSPEQFTGRFNAHLRDCVLLFADEAVSPKYSEAEAKLKQLITEPVIAYEGKGATIVQGKNMLHIGMASNQHWVIVASEDARRFVISDVSDRYKQDQEFFGRLWRQMENGGYEALLHDMLAVDLTGWRPAVDRPGSAALADQKHRSLPADERFWETLLQAGEFPFPTLSSGEEVDWASGPVTMGERERSALVEAYSNFLTHRRLYAERSTHKALVKGGKCCGLTTGRGSGNTERTWTVPPLHEARAAFERHLGAENLFC